MKPQLSLAALLASAVVLLSLAPSPVADGSLTVDASCCKPTAAIEIEVLENSVASGVAYVRYRVASSLDTTRLESSVVLPDGGRVLNDQGVRTFDSAANTDRIGSTRVRLPAGSGARITLRASATFRASGGELDGLQETMVATKTLTWGTVDLTPDLPEVSSGGTISLDTAATRTGGDN